MRYYVFHRLVRGTALRDPSGWRLPAPALEEKVADLIWRHLKRPEVRTGILFDAAADETAEIGTRLFSLGESKPDSCADAQKAFLTIAERIDISPGEICILISAERLARVFDMDQTRIVEDFLTVVSPFQHRKRGVETKLIIGDEPSKVDATLLRNIALAHRYFDLVKSGKTFGEIADSEGASKRRVQHLIELAFLAPDVIRSVRDGKQPIGPTSEWLKRHAFSPI